ncbi:uncharacterized protein TNCV_645031 [Trichonephila clavipes]|nr:uncharacterized protein TNCV_645031 [Trichonephila clavipes]
MMAAFVLDVMPGNSAFQSALSNIIVVGHLELCILIAFFSFCRVHGQSDNVVSSLNRLGKGRWGCQSLQEVGLLPVGPRKWLATLTVVPLGLGSNPGEDMDVCKCLVPSRHGGTLNSRRDASPLVRLVGGEERWEAPD